MPFDYTLFDRQVLQEEHRLALVLKGHLWIEACLNRALEVALHDPARLNLERESFARKVTLAASLHAIPGDAEALLVALNRLRNKIAHQLDKEVTREDAAALTASIQGRMRASYDEIFSPIENESVIDELRHMFIFAVMVLEHATMMREYEKRNAEAISTYRLVRAISERLGSRQGVQPRRSALVESYMPPEPPHPRDVWTDRGQMPEGHAAEISTDERASPGDGP